MDRPTSSMRSLWSRMGAYRQQATHDTRETTAAARRAFADRFVREVDPDGVLPLDERMRRAEAARKAWFARLAYLSAKKRAHAKARRQGAAR